MKSRGLRVSNVSPPPRSRRGTKTMEVRATIVAALGSFYGDHRIRVGNDRPYVAAATTLDRCPELDHVPIMFLRSR
jgi:hypothetical protein